MGLVLLGVHLIVGGLSSLVLGATSALALGGSGIDPWEAISLGTTAGSLAAGGVQRVAGALLWRLGRRYALDAPRGRPR